jgi:hypothetical protein
MGRLRLGPEIVLTPSGVKTPRELPRPPVITGGDG